MGIARCGVTCCVFFSSEYRPESHTTISIVQQFLLCFYTDVRKRWLQKGRRFLSVMLQVSVRDRAFMDVMQSQSFKLFLPQGMGLHYFALIRSALVFFEWHADLFCFGLLDASHQVLFRTL